MACLALLGSHGVSQLGVLWGSRWHFAAFDGIQYQVEYSRVHEVGELTRGFKTGAGRSDSKIPEIRNVRIADVWFLRGAHPAALLGGSGRLSQ